MKFVRRMQRVRKLLLHRAFSSSFVWRRHSPERARRLPYNSRARLEDRICRDVNETERRLRTGNRKVSRKLDIQRWRAPGHAHIRRRW
jgi:hypothetical protein